MPMLDELHAATIRDLDAAFAELGVVGTIIGGVAVSLLATPRYTADLVRSSSSTLPASRTSFVS
jgi:hypothetical protein